jgi:hypothetical protein
MSRKVHALAVLLVVLAGCARSRHPRAPVVEEPPPPEREAAREPARAPTHDPVIEDAPPADHDVRAALQHWVAYDAAASCRAQPTRRRRVPATSSWGPDIDPFAATQARDEWVVEEGVPPLCRQTVTIGSGFLSPEGVWTDDGRSRRGRR